VQEPGELWRPVVDGCGQVAQEVRLRGGLAELYRIDYFGDLVPVARGDQLLEVVALVVAVGLDPRVVSVV